MAAPPQAQQEPLKVCLSYEMDQGDYSDDWFDDQVGAWLHGDLSYLKVDIHDGIDGTEKTWFTVSGDGHEETADGDRSDSEEKQDLGQEAEGCRPSLAPPPGLEKISYAAVVGVKDDGDDNNDGIYGGGQFPGVGDGVESEADGVQDMSHDIKSEQLPGASDDFEIEADGVQSQQAHSNADDHDGADSDNSLSTGDSNDLAYARKYSVDRVAAAAAGAATVQDIFNDKKGQSPGASYDFEIEAGGGQDTRYDMKEQIPGASDGIATEADGKQGSSNDMKIETAVPRRRSYAEVVSKNREAFNRAAKARSERGAVSKLPTDEGANGTKEVVCITLAEVIGQLGEHGLRVDADGAQALLHYLRGGGEMATFLEWASSAIQPAG